MSDEPYTVRNRVMWCSGLASAVLLLAGAVCADEIDKTSEPAAWRDGYSDREYYGSPGFGALGYLDPGYAFTFATEYGNPIYDTGGYGVRGYGWGGGLGYPGYGLAGYGYPGYGYDLGGRGYYASSAAESGTVPTADRRYIRQLEERIRKLEKANQQSLPAYSERSAQASFSSFSANQSTHEAPAAGYAVPSGFQKTASQPATRSEYPTYQPSYGSPPRYQFRQ